MLRGSPRSLRGPVLLGEDDGLIGLNGSDAVLFVFLHISSLNDAAFTDIAEEGNWLN